jgi:glycosyltransferase involved in cell wall biosynthesis
VNTNLFYPSVKNSETPFRFIHISSLIDQKNPKGIVRSFIELRKQNFEAELLLAGPLTTELMDYINLYDVGTGIRCTGEISYEQVSIELRKSSSLILFSFYENMPCVILEALCTGIPVISTRVGGIPEVIHDKNGILIQPGNEIELQEAMKQMMMNFSKFDREKISRQAREQFSYETIGQQITNVYRSVLAGK